MVRPSNSRLGSSQIEADKKVRAIIESILIELTSESSKREFRTAAKVFRLAEALNQVDSSLEPARSVIAGGNKWGVDFFADQGVVILVYK